MQMQATKFTGIPGMQFVPFRLRITHIDNGAYEGITIMEPNTGKWPKVSFNDGETFSYWRLTNTKILFATGGFEDVFTDRDYQELVLEFLKSPRPFKESNWNVQPHRENNWKPEFEEAERELAVA